MRKPHHIGSERDGPSNKAFCERGAAILIDERAAERAVS